MYLWVYSPQPFMAQEIMKKLNIRGYETILVGGVTKLADILEVTSNE